MTRIATPAKTIAMGEVVMAKKLPRWMFMQRTKFFSHMGPRMRASRPVCGLFLFPVKSYLPGALVQYLVEAGEEGDGCNGRCQNITDRLSEKDAEALICREAGQDKNQRDK